MLFRKNWLCISINLALIIIIIYSGYLLSVKAMHIEEIQKELINFKFITDRYGEDYKLILASNESKINNILLTDMNDKSYNISQLVNEKLLIYRFFKNSCKPCVDNDIILLKTLYQKYLAILVRFVPPISEWFVPVISVQTVPPGS